MLMEMQSTKTHKKKKRRKDGKGKENRPPFPQFNF